jgi:type VI secretion system protein ImpH
MFYRAWTKYRPEILYETVTDGQTTRFERAIFALLGISDRERLADLPFDARGLLHHARALRRRGATAESLAEMIEDYFGVGAAVEAFRSRSYGMARDERSRLGRHASQLGESLALGARVEIAQYAFGIVLGPLDREQFEDFLPAGRGHADLTTLTRLAVGPEFDYSITLRLAEGAAPPCRLAGAGATGSQLGWSTWLRSLATDHREQQVTLAVG